MWNVKKISFVILAGLVGTLSAYDLKTKELVPVKFEKAPVHSPVKMVENGKTITKIHKLNLEEQVEELARLRGLDK